MEPDSKNSEVPTRCSRNQTPEELSYKVLTQGTPRPPRYRRLVKECLWIGTGKGAVVLGSLVLVRLLTECLSPTQFGELALGLTIAAFANQVVLGGISTGIARFYTVAAERGELKCYLIACLRLVVYATLCLALLGAALAFVIVLANMKKWLPLLASVLIFSVSSGFCSALSGLLNAARQRSIVAIHGALDAWIRILLVFGLVSWLGSTNAIIAIAYAASSFIISLSQLFFIQKPSQNETSRADGQRSDKWTESIWSFSRPFSAWGVFTWAQMSSDRWALQSFSDSHNVGQYSAVFQLGYAPIGLAANLAVTLLGPILYERAGNAMDMNRNAAVHRLTWRIALFSLCLTGFAFLATLIFHKFIFALLVASPYWESSRFLPWIVLSGGLFATGQVLALKLLSELRSRSMSAAKIVTALFGICSNIVGAWLLGATGVVASLLLFSLLYLAWMVLLAIRVHLPNSGAPVACL